MEEPKKRVATYARVSTDEQKQRMTIGNQTEALARYEQTRPDAEVLDRFEDPGISGTVPFAERPAGRRLLANARAAKYDEVWVTRADRLGRDAPDMLALWKTFKELRVRPVGVQQSIESYLSYGIQVLFADDEHETIRSRLEAEPALVSERDDGALFGHDGIIGSPRSEDDGADDDDFLAVHVPHLGRVSIENRIITAAFGDEWPEMELLQGVIPAVVAAAIMAVAAMVTDRRVQKRADDFFREHDKRAAELAARIIDARIAAEEARSREDEIRGWMEQVSVRLAGTDLLDQGRLRLLEGNLEAAIEVLSGVLKVEPTNVEALRLRGEAYRRSGDYPSAYGDLSAVVVAGDDPQSQVALASTCLHLDLPGEAVKYARQALDGGLSDRAMGLQILATGLEADGREPEALRVFRQILEEFPFYAPAVVGIGAILSTQAARGESAWDEVVNWFGEAIARQDGVSDYYFFRGKALWQRDRTGDRDRALTDYERAKELSPRDTKPLEELGRRYLERGREKRTQGSNRGGADDISRAIDFLTRGAEVAPGGYRPVFRSLLSLAYQELGQFDRAVEQTRRGVQENPRFVQNQMALATALLAARSWSEAARVAESTRSNKSWPSGTGGLVWMAVFEIIGKAFSGASLGALRSPLTSLADLMESDLQFDASRWDWVHARASAEGALGQADGLGRSVVEDVMAVLDGKKGTEALKRWL